MPKQMNIQQSAEELTRLAAFGQGVLALVQESGLLKKPVRRKAKRKEAPQAEESPLAQAQEERRPKKKLKKKKKRPQSGTTSSEDSGENS